MSEHSDRDASSSSPLAGLVPSRLRATTHTTTPARHLAPREQSRVAKSLLATMPVLLVGTLAISTMNLVGPGDVAAGGRPQRHKSDTSDLGILFGAAFGVKPARPATLPDDITLAADVTAAPVVVPPQYTVRAGDTVSGIAGRYHLSTASVLALNGLGWKSLIFPGQILKLTKTPASTPPVSVTPPTAPVTPPTTPVTPPVTSQTAVPPIASYTPPTVTPPTVTPPTVTTPPPAASGEYVIKSGDTITAIAKKLGVTVQAILTANHLTASSIIYAGRTLVIPGVQLAEVGTPTVPLSPSMSTNAATIIAVGKRLGVPSYGIIIALAAAAQESGLEDLTYGDRDSVGLFQQRPSAGWGTTAQLLNTTYASELFFGGPSNPNKGKTRGLLDIPGWQSMTVTQAAQAVQISGAPNAYAKWEASARAWFALLG